MAREKVEFDVIGRDVGGSKAFRDVGDAAGKAADKLDDVGAAAATAGAKVEASGDQATEAGEQYRGLAAEIELVEGNVRRLAAEIDRTGNKELFGDLRRQQAELRKLNRVRDLLPDMGQAGVELAEQVSVSFAEHLPKTIARAARFTAANPAVLAIGAPIAIGVASMVGTAVGGAIVGAVGVGGVVGGLALAAKDPAVKAAGTELGADLSAMLGRSSAAFVPETLDAIDTIRERALRLEPAFNRAFSSAARFVDPLVDGLLDAGENALPGVIDVLDSAGPVIDEIADAARGFGDAVGDGLSDLAPYADEGARALRLLFTTMEGGVRAAFALVEGMAKLYSVAEIVGAVMTGNVGRVFELVTAEERAKGSSVDLTGVLGPLANGLRNVGDEAITAEDAARDLKTAFDELFNPQLSYDRAVIAYRDGVKELNKELREGKRTLDVNTQAGRDNATAVLDQIERIKELRDTRLEQGESIDVVDGKYRKEIGAIRSKLQQMGYEKSEIDALLGKYEKIPDRVATRVDAETIQAERELAKVRSLIAQIKSKKVVITTQHNTIVTRSEGRNVPIGDVGGRAGGGVTLRGETYWVGERGPELLTFADNGYVLNSSKSEQIARQSLSQGPAQVASVMAGASVDDLYRAFVRALQTVPVARTDSARTADLYSRVG